jgi:hypothetical protein
MNKKLEKVVPIDNEAALPIRTSSFVCNDFFFFFCLKEEEEKITSY